MGGPRWGANAGGGSGASHAARIVLLGAASLLALMNPGCGGPNPDEPGDATVGGPDGSAPMADGGAPAADAQRPDSGGGELGPDAAEGFDGGAVEDAAWDAGEPDAAAPEDGGLAVCAAGTSRSCYSGPAETRGRGTCREGSQVCLSDGSGYGECAGEVLPRPEDCATPEDEDCSGAANDSCACTPGSAEPCYTGPTGTLGVGACKAGTWTCNAEGIGFGPCTGEVVPSAETCDTPEDDDCDGQVNEEGAGCACAPGQAVSCYSGPAGTSGVGLCQAGSKICNEQGTGFGPCVGEVLPAVETCRTLGDDDCDGQTNEEGEGCACVPGTTVTCYSGPSATLGVGRCQSGLQVCNAQGTGFGPCVGEVVPAPETCNTPEDDDCDGQTNEEGEGCVCPPGAVGVCYSGPPGTAGVGICRAGTRACDARGTRWGPCVGEVLPGVETCQTPEDDDCDGQTNESGTGCVCGPGSVVSCYSGPAGTQGVGSCRPGQQTCNAQGTGYGPCVGEVLPGVETCLTPDDDDCDGLPNENGAGCVCLPGSAAACYSGPAGTAGVGHCRAGLQTCNAQGTAYGPCVGEVLPGVETCLTPEDDDCNGQVNEGGVGCVCLPGSTAACYSGPVGTAGVGIRKAGTKTCDAQGTGYGPCVGEVLPGVETCLTPEDEDCNGQANEGGAGCVCQPGSSTSCYSGPAGTQGVGPCKAGLQTCNAQGTAYGACVGEVVPAVESCTTPADDNCNGQVNEGCVYYGNVQPIFQAKCGSCHTTGGSGGSNFATKYSDSQLPSSSCPGKTKGACTIVRIQNGTMPAGAGCTGNPAQDSGKPKCTTASEQATIQVWINGGQLP
ncbi:MAG: hypothetical protein QM765_24775 [Myxococcales bacterium]